MSVPIEKTPNIGKTLGQRLRHVGIETREQLEELGDAKAFSLLCNKDWLARWGL
jgi:hypothetical protein